MYLFIKIGQRERTCRIPGVILLDYPEVEVIAFQELFLGGCWPGLGSSFRDLLRYHGFNYTTKNVGIKRQFNDKANDNTDTAASGADDKEVIIGPKLLNGGTFIASRYAIEEEDNHVFSDSSRLSFDRFSSKGVSYAKIRKDAFGESKTFHVFATHMQAGRRSRDVREQQAIEFQSFIKSKKIPSVEPVIIAGDFNMHAESGRISHVQDMMTLLRAKALPIIGSMQSTTQSGSWLDFVMYSNDHQQPLLAVQKIVTPRTAEPFLICTRAHKIGYVSPYSSECEQVETRIDLSDHYAIIGTFSF